MQIYFICLSNFKWTQDLRPQLIYFRTQPNWKITLLDSWLRSYIWKIEFVTFSLPEQPATVVQLHLATTISIKFFFSVDQLQKRDWLSLPLLSAHFVLPANSTRPPYINRQDSKSVLQRMLAIMFWKKIENARFP